ATTPSGTRSGLCCDSSPTVSASRCPTGAPHATCVATHGPLCVAPPTREQSIRGADDFGVEPMLRLAASRAVVDPTPWWGTPVWRERLNEFQSSNKIG